MTDPSRSEKRKETLAARSRYDIGLQSIDSTEILVKQMSVALEELQPVLIKTSEETEVCAQRWVKGQRSGDER